MYLALSMSPMVRITCVSLISLLGKAFHVDIRYPVSGSEVTKYDGHRSNTSLLDFLSWASLDLSKTKALSRHTVSITRVQA